MSLSLGIVGLPNVGKSTLFNALVKNGQAAASNYPFTTIEPNVGIVEVPDSRLQELAKLVHPERIVAAHVEFVDIAGLIKGASKGEGLGSKFLSHIRETAAILLVARFFEHPDVVHVNGALNPKLDLETVLLELILSDLDSVQKGIERYQKSSRGGDKTALAALQYAEKLQKVLENEQPAHQLPATEEAELLVQRELQLLTSKPILIVANVGDDQLQLTAEQIFEQHDLKTLVPSAQWVIPLSAKLESELISLPEAEQAEYLESYNIPESGLIRLIRQSYQLLALETFFTAGPKEVRAWTIRKGSRAPQAAGVIHTDFEKGFIRAEVISYSDYVQFKGETGAKEAGRLRLEGKEYIMKDGDVVHFRFNV